MPAPKQANAMVMTAFSALMETDVTPRSRWTALVIDAAHDEHSSPEKLIATCRNSPNALETITRAARIARNAIPTV
jgi:hypothetical protein